MYDIGYGIVHYEYDIVFVIGYDIERYRYRIGYGIVLSKSRYRTRHRANITISCLISYDLRVLVAETVSWNVEGVASRLRPSVEHVTLPLDAAKCAKMAVGAIN